MCEQQNLKRRNIQDTHANINRTELTEKLMEISELLKSLIISPEHLTVCWIWGQQEHFKRNCSKIKQNNTIKINEELDNSYNVSPPITRVPIYYKGSRHFHLPSQGSKRSRPQSSESLGRYFTRPRHYIKIRLLFRYLFKTKM